MIFGGQCAHSATKTGPARAGFARARGVVLSLVLIGFAAESALAATTAAIVSNAGTDNTYKVGDDIDIDVTFDNVVYVQEDQDGLKLELILGIGENYRRATFVDGSGSSDMKLHFRYTVQSGDEDDDGISIANGSTSLVGGLITLGAGTAVTDRSFTAVPANTAHKVDGIIPTVTTGGVTITSMPKPDSNNTYSLAEPIEVSVTFDEIVHVDETVTELVLVLSIGQHSRQAMFVGGSGSTTLRFGYTVQRGDEDDDGISIGPGPSSLQGASVTDFAGNPVDRTFDGVPAVEGQHEVDGVTPSLNAARITSSPESGDTYGLNEEIRVAVDFGEEVHATDPEGDLELILSIGQHSRSAKLADGSGTTTLTFAYVVQSDDEDEDGISIGPTALQGGILEDAAGNPVDRTFGGRMADGNHKVDGVSPSLRAMEVVSSPAAAGVYGLNETIMVDVDFNEEVHVDETETELVLVLAIGQHSREATFVEGSGTATLKFSYVVQSDDRDDDGISIGPGISATEGSLTGAKMHDKAGNVVDRAFVGVGAQSGHKVDGMTTPQAAVRIVSTPAASGTYGLNEEIRVQVSFGEVVHVTGSVTLALDIGANERAAPYSGGSGTDTLEFRYVVRSDDKDDDGISIGSDALDGGTIEDGDGNAVNRAVTRLAPDSSHKVDGTSASLSGVRIVSNPDSGSTYGVDEAIRVAVDFGRVVHVTNPEQGPTLLMSIGENIRTASLASGSGTETLTFRYVVQAGDYDGDGISVGANALQGGGIEDAGGNPVVRTFAGLAADSRHRVDGLAPVLDEVRIVSLPRQDGTYAVSEEITIEVEFDEEVHVKDQVTIDVTIGEHTRQATFVTGSGTETLTFRYVVQADDYDDDGISIPADCLRGMVQDVAGNPVVDLGYRGQASDSRYRVDGLNTAQLVIQIVAPRDHDGIYGLSEEIRVVVDFPGEVHVTGDPTLTLSIGEHSREATLANGSGTKRLTFRYVVQSDDEDDDGISIGPNALRGGVIEDAEGNRVARVFPGLSADTEHSVDGISPSLTDVRIVETADHDGIYGLNEEIRVEIDFGEEVHVTGQVSLVLSIGEHLRVADLVSGSGTDTLTFRYVVQSGDSDVDGISIGPNALRGTGIEDAAGNALVLGFDGLSAAGNHKVDGIGPELAEVRIVEPHGHDRIYRLTEAITVEVEFSEVVHVTGGEANLSVMLSIGQHLRAATFVSGSGTETLTFRYVVQAGDSDDDGISIGPNALQGGTIEDAAGNVVTRTFSGLPANRRHMVETIAAVVPVVEDVIFDSNAGSNDTYTTGDEILLHVVFNVVVYVRSDPPVLKLSIGSIERDAVFQEGSGTEILKFQYVVEPGDTDDDGISIGPNALIGSIEDGGGNAVDLTLPAMEAQSEHKVSAELMLYPLSLTLLVGEVEVIDLSRQLNLLGVEYDGEFDVTSDESSIVTAERSGRMLTITSVTEGDATITAKAVDAAIFLFFGVTVETSPEETAVLEDALAAVGRGMIASAESTIGARLEMADSNPPDVWGGLGMTPSSAWVAAWPQWSALDTAHQWESPMGYAHWAVDDPYLQRSMGYTPAQLLRGRWFEMPFGGYGNNIDSWAVWGAGDYHAFQGSPEGGTYDGSLASAYLGVDARGHGWVAGATISRSLADVSYEFAGPVDGKGRLETELDVIHPYVQWAFGNRGKMWAILGFGTGEATTEREDQAVAAEPSELSMHMGLGGLRYSFGRVAWFDLAVRGDAGYAKLQTDEGPRAIEGLTVNVQRVRLGAEASLPMALAGMRVSPFIDVAGRFDGGDGETGGGVELAGGFRYRGPLIGLEVKGRTLAMHSAESYSEEGLKATLVVGPDGRKGFRLMLAPRWGGAAEAMDIFRYRGHPFAGALRRENRGWGLGTRISYGFDTLRRPGTVMPFAEMDLSGDASRRARLGVSYEIASAVLGLPHRLEISGEGTESELHGTIMRFLLTGQAHF